MSLPSVEMGSLFLAARLARVIATTTYHRLSRCAYSIARAGMPILERAITIYDREAHAHGLHTRTAHRQMSLSSQCAECRVQCAGLCTRIHQPNQCAAVVWARGVAARVVRWQSETRIKVQPSVPHRQIRQQ